MRNPHFAGPVRLRLTGAVLTGFVTAVLSFTFTVPVFAHHADSSGPFQLQPCYDVLGQGKPVSFPGVGGVPNSGVISFDSVGGNPLHDYEACVFDPDCNPAVGDF